MAKADDQVTTEQFTALQDQLTQALALLQRTVARLDSQEMLLSGLSSTVSQDLVTLRREQDETGTRLDDISARFNRLFPPADPRVRSYQAVRARDLRQMTPQESEAFGAGLREWVQRVLVRQLGYFAYMLPPCWEQHSLCLYALDKLAQAWNYDHGQPRRNRRDLDTQAEYFIRVLPGLLNMIVTEAKECLQKREHVERDAPAALIPALTARPGGEAA